MALPDTADAVRRNVDAPDNEFRREREVAAVPHRLRYNIRRAWEGNGRESRNQEAEPDDAPAIMEIHLTARREAIPYLHRVHTDDETRDCFAQVVGYRHSAWWVAHRRGQIVDYILIDGEDIAHLYVSPGWQRRGVGLSLFAKAKALSPGRLDF